MKRLLAVAAVRDESGMTLIEMLVAAMMSVIVVGASCAMLISAVRDQPALSSKAQNITTARYQLERIVREIRNGVQLETTTPSRITLVARVRRVACGGAVQPSSAPNPCNARSPTAARQILHPQRSDLERNPGRHPQRRRRRAR